LAAPLYLVSNEVGGGIVPENQLARQFRDLAGEANQLAAAAADEAWLVVVGLLKSKYAVGQKRHRLYGFKVFELVVLVSVAPSSVFGTINDCPR
jgi:hypothetical protein